jgi:hypothetical protein
MAFNLEVLRYPMYRIIEPATRWLVRNRVHPNVITTFGFIATVSSGYFYHQDHVRVAGFLVLFGGLFAGWPRSSERSTTPCWTG